MRKKDLIKAAKKGFPDPEKMVNNILLAMNTAFINKETISILNFGTFKPYKAKVKKAYCFKQKKMVTIESPYNIKFIICPEVKKRMNEKGDSNG